jgi:hypothetical protein
MANYFKKSVTQALFLGVVLSLGLGGLSGGAIAQTASPSPPPSTDNIPLPPGIEDTTSPNPADLVPLDDSTQPNPINLSPLNPSGRALPIKNQPNH